MGLFPEPHYLLRGSPVRNTPLERGPSLLGRTTVPEVWGRGKGMYKRKRTRVFLIRILLFVAVLSMQTILPQYAAPPQ